MNGAPAEGGVVGDFEVLVLEGGRRLGRERQQGRARNLRQRRVEQAQDDQRQDRAVGQATHGEQHEAERGVHQQHVARPEQRGMRQADRQQHGQPARVDPRRAAAGPRRLEPAELQVKADAEQQAEHQVELAGEQQVAQPRDPGVERSEVGHGRREHRSAEPRHVHNEDAEQGDAAEHVEGRDALGDRQRRLDLGRGCGGVVHEPTVANAARRPVGAQRHTGARSMFRTAIAGSLPKPAWLAETEKLWPEWKADGAGARAGQGRCHAALAQGAGRRGPGRSSATASSRASTSSTASSSRSKASTSSTR